MMFTTRFWGGAAVLLCALLLQGCQLHSVSVIDAAEEKERAASPSSASAMHQRAPSEPLTMRSLVSLSVSPAAYVPPSLLSTTAAHKEELSATLATVSNAHQDSTSLSKQRPQNLEDDLDKSNEQACAGERWEQECVRRDALSMLLAMARSEPDKATEFLDVLLTSAQDNDCRQQALKALGKVTKASSNMLSECLPSLRAAAKSGDRDVRLFALKTLGEIEWKHYLGEVEPAPDLPSNMSAILDSACPFWPGKRVRDTHLLVLIPATVSGEPFTLNLLEQLIQHPKNGEQETRYRDYAGTVKTQSGAVSPAMSYWILMTRDVLPESRGKTYANQKRLVTDHARRTSLPYKLPKALEAATAILTHYVRDGERLYGESPLTYTRCQELIQFQFSEYPAVVGGFEPSSLVVGINDYGRYGSIGVAGCRRFF
jgi:hypothetical protein